ncbi:MAG: hypothetical protein JXA11_01280 [Phycisphaerae bacterium]|nr:hypothetical protein [Phycisphaerae bacterium]
MMRYPGGCLTHNFDWRKTIGPLEQRANPEWYFGLDEFIALCRQGGLEPVITVSDYVFPAEELPQYSANLVEYLNAPARPEYPWAMKRKEYGHPQSYGVKYFELGNETNHGNHKVIPGRVFSAEEYVAYAKKTAAAMRKIDPNIKIGLNLNNAKWDQTVLSKAGSLTDFWIKHFYKPPFDEAMDARKNTIIATSYQPRVEATIQKHLQKIKQLTKKNIPLAITEYNSGGRGHLRRSYLAGYTNAQMIQLFLQPSNNVILANYWHLLNDWWGIVLARDGVVTKRYAPVAFFQTWAEFLGDQIIEAKVDSPLLETPSVGGWGASTKLNSNRKNHRKKLILGENFKTDYNTPGVEVKFPSENSMIVRLKNRDRDLYANFREIPRPASAPVGEPIVFTIRFKGRFLPAKGNTHKAGMGLGLVDTRGWEAVKSATRILGTDKTRQWKTFEKTFTTLADCTGVYLVARLETVSGPISGSMQFKDIEVFLDAPKSYPPFQAVTATAMLSKDKKTLTMVLFNKTLDTPTPVEIQLIHFQAASAEGRELHRKDVKSSREMKARHFPLDVKGKAARLILPPHSMTAIRFRSQS